MLGVWVVYKLLPIMAHNPVGCMKHNSCFVGGSAAFPFKKESAVCVVHGCLSWESAQVYGEIEFECNHWSVFENAIDMAHIHYLHNDTFGNQVRARAVKRCTAQMHTQFDRCTPSTSVGCCIAATVTYLRLG